MAKFIPLRHINRMFPFEFYKELSEVLTTHVSINPAFILPLTAKADLVDTEEKQKQLWHDIRQMQKESIRQQTLTNQTKISDLELLILEPFEEVSNINAENGSQIEKRNDLLVVQLYDKNQNPVFTPDTHIDVIREIPEVLFDDPNLLIALFTSERPDGTESQIQFLKLPSYIESKLTTKIQAED